MMRYQDFREADQAILEASARSQLKRSLQHKLTQAQRLLHSEKERLSSLTDSLVKEEKDVKRLQGMSLIGLFHELRGQKDKALEKEQREYLAARLKYDEAKTSIDALESQIRKIKKHIETLGDPEADLEQARRAKENMLLSHGGQEAEEISKIQRDMGILISQKKELREAIAAGNRVLSSLELVADSLSSAQSWGMWDLLGGGIISTAVKHSKIDDAQECLNQAQREIYQFKQELADIDIDFDLEIGGFERFADYFFDGLIVDWMVQSKINKSLDRTKEQQLRVKRTLANLHEGMQTVDNKIEFLKKRKQQLIDG